MDVDVWGDEGISSSQAILTLDLTDLGSPVSVPDIDVSPTSHDFGDVEVGSTKTTVVAISNTGDADLFINSITFASGSSGDFSITSALSLPLPQTILPNESVDVEITFAPTAIGYAEAVLEISSNDSDESLVQVGLMGLGVGSEGPPSEQIQEILEFVDGSVEEGDLEGVGPGKSANGRLNALINMIETAGDLIEDGLYEEAYQQLEDAYKRCDGQSPPPDFVQGEAAEELAGMIQTLMESL